MTTLSLAKVFLFSSIAAVCGQTVATAQVNVRQLLGKPASAYAKVLGKPVSVQRFEKDGTLYTYRKKGLEFKRWQNALIVTATGPVASDFPSMLKFLGFPGTYGQVIDQGNFQGKEGRGTVQKVTKVTGARGSILLYKGTTPKGAPFMSLDFPF